MIAKTEERQLAETLRRKGHSLNEISANLKVSKASVSVWVRSVTLDAKAQKIIAKKKSESRARSTLTHRRQTQKALENAELLSVDSVLGFPKIKAAIRVLCAMIYWCEGTKSLNDAECTFTNSDPALVRTFITLFRKGFSIEESRFRICMHLHAYHDEKRQILFWSKVTGIPEDQFIKTYQKKNTGKRTKDGYQGCIQVRYHDVRMARELQALARGYMDSVGAM